MGNPGPWAIGAPAAALGNLQPGWPQTHNLYAYRAYGKKGPGRSEIFLVQRPESNHFDIADFVLPPGPAPAPGPGPLVRNWGAMPRTPAGLAWWLPPAGGGPAPAVSPPVIIVPPPVTTPQYMPVTAAAAAAAAFVPALPNTILSPAVMKRFMAGVDIRGDMFVLPSAAVTALWVTYNQVPPVFPQPRLPGVAHQIRFGPRQPGGVRKLRVPPQLEDPILAYEDDEN